MLFRYYRSLDRAIAVGRLDAKVCAFCVRLVRGCRSAAASERVVECGSSTWFRHHQSPSRSSHNTLPPYPVLPLRQVPGDLGPLVPQRRVHHGYSAAAGGLRDGFGLKARGLCCGQIEHRGSERTRCPMELGNHTCSLLHAPPFLLCPISRICASATCSRPCAHPPFPAGRGKHGTCQHQRLSTDCQHIAHCVRAGHLSFYQHQPGASSQWCRADRR